MMRKRVAAVVLALSMPLAGVPSAAYAGDGWRQIPTPELKEKYGLTDLASDGQGVWITGNEGYKCLLYMAWKASRICVLAASGDPVVRKYDGTNWQKYPLWGARQGIYAVEAYDGEVWIQGMYDYIARFTGSSFLPVLSPEGDKKLQDVGPAGVWLSVAGKLYRRTGWTWTQAELPSDLSMVFGVSTRSATDAWMVGTRAWQHGYVARWDGTAWTEVPAPPTQGILWNVEVGPGSDVWVTTSQRELAHWNGTEWTVLPAPAAGNLSSLSVDPDGVPWLVYGGVPYRYVNGAFTPAPPLPGGMSMHFLDAQGTSPWGLAGDQTDYSLVTTD